MADLDLTPEQKRLVLAISDMLQAAAAARILNQQRDLQARRAIETAISVCYARPWIDSNRGGKLKNKWLPEDGPDRKLHHRLLELRRMTYAHSDPASGRKPFVQCGNEGVLGIGEQWNSLPPSESPAIIALCERQEARFRQPSTTSSAPRGTPSRRASARLHPPSAAASVPSRSSVSIASSRPAIPAWAPSRRVP